MDSSEDRLEIHRDPVALGKAFAVAFAVGLDVLAISVTVGIARLPFDASLRLGVAFAGFEIAMPVMYIQGSWSRDMGDSWGVAGDVHALLAHQPQIRPLNRPSRLHGSSHRRSILSWSTSATTRTMCSRLG
jgi:hypothetical protein